MGQGGDHPPSSRQRTLQGVVTLPDAVMDRWLTQLQAFTSPRRDKNAGPYPRRLAHAFTALLERIPDDWLPQHGGTNTTLVVTVDHEKLRQDLATAGLTTGTPITASEARRLACGAGILPAVLDGRSSRSTSAGRSGCSPPPSARPSRSATGIAAPIAATCPPPGARPTTCNRGAQEAGPTSPTACSSAPSTTTAPTTPVTA